MNWRLITALCAAVTVIGAVTAISMTWGRVDPDRAGILSPGDLQIVNLGRTLYEENCASCHGVNLQGEPNWQRPTSDGLMPAPPHDETGHTWHHPDELLIKITKYGIGKAANLESYVSAMPIYEGILTDDEIIAVLSYIKSTWPEEIQIGHDELNRRYTLEPSS